MWVYGLKGHSRSSKITLFEKPHYNCLALHARDVSLFSVHYVFDCP